MYLYIIYEAVFQNLQLVLKIYNLLYVHYRFSELSVNF